MAQAGEGSPRPRPQAQRPQKSNCKHQRVSLGPWPPSLSDWRSGRWGGPELHSRLGITGLHFLLEQNNYSLHRGPEFPESNVGRQLRARLRLQKHKLILIRVGEEEGQSGTRVSGENALKSRGLQMGPACFGPSPLMACQA